MKKVIFAVFFIFLLLLSKITITADNINYSSDFINKYYRKLNTYYLPNYSNTLCGYQAFCTLLCYWDNYWDENFIETDIDMKASVDGLGFYYYDDISSPGIKRITMPTNESGYVYNAYFEPNSNFASLPENEKIAIFAASVHYNNDYSLFGKLLNLVNSNITDFNSTSVLNSLYLNGMTIEQAFALYDSYFSDLNLNTSFNASNYYFVRQSGITISGDQVTITDLKNDVINYLNNDYPVLCLLVPHNSGTYNYSFSGHFVVCYDYDSVGDIIYGHTDYATGTNTIVDTHYNIDDYADEVTIAGYYVIIPKNTNTHTCTWAYLNNNDFDELKHYCPCYITSHIHTITYNQNTHSCTDLECGMHEEHEGTYSQYNRYSHYLHCDTCNTSFIKSHDFEIHSNYSICRKCNYYVSGSDIIIYKKEEDDFI